MLRHMKKSKIHRATVTEANLDYMGSITIDRTLMEAADILQNEKVLVVNLNNGTRFETYAISGESDTGVVCLNGGAARMACKGDKVIIISFGIYHECEMKFFHSIDVYVDNKNLILRNRL